MDNVIIGGMTLHNQGVEEATELSPSFQQSAGDGLLGLGFVSCSICCKSCPSSFADM
jgi:hypothetical protein